MVVKYFFDTYALCEFCEGNEKYKKYFEKYDIITSNLNLMELFYYVLNNFGLEKAKYYYKRFKPFIIEIPDDIIERAMIFRLENKKQRLSYIDCVGYTLSLSNNLKFLTGDKEFKDFKNVEYVK